MQSLHLLGVPVAGVTEPAVSVSPNRDAAVEEYTQAAKAHGQRMNPRGFYEVPGVVINGTRNIKKWEGQAIKIVTSGIWPRTLDNGMEMGTPPELVDKYIFCTRHPLQIAQSQQDLAGRNVLGPAEDDEEWALPRRSASPLPFLMRSGPAVIWLSNQPQELLDRFISVDFSDMIADAEKQLSTVMAHIDRPYTAEQMSVALDNVRGELNRSTSMSTWAEGMENAGAVAEKMYAALKSMDLTELSAAAVAVQEFFFSQQYEGASWVDDEDTWVTMSVPTKRLVAKNANGLADNLRGQVAEYRAGFMICDQCEFYERDPAKTYTIQRPADLGPLTRPMVKCARDGEYKTVEMCKSCWQQGSTVNGELLPAQRETQLKPVG
jgi:hypothetical protein